MMILVNHDYHIVELNKRPPAEVFEWLQIKYGPGDGLRWMYKSPRIYFSNPQDHLMFLLKWGSE
jgi:hypothetical protein